MKNRGVRFDKDKRPIFTLNSSDGKRVEYVSDEYPTDIDVMKALEEKGARREKARKASKVGQEGLKRLRNLSLGLTALAAASVLMMQAYSGKSVNRQMLDKPTLKTLGPETQTIHYYRLTPIENDDIWRYVKLYSQQTDTPIEETEQIIENANPDVALNAVPGGDSVVVPELPNVAEAGQEGLKTNQPIGDVHVN